MTGRYASGATTALGLEAQLPTGSRDQFLGDGSTRVGGYLSAAGQASLNLIRMARPGLLMQLREAMQAARKRGTTARREGIRMRQDGGFLAVKRV